MRMPARPPSHCISAHPQQVRSVFDARVNRPPPPAHPHLGGQRGVRWGLTPVSRHLPCLEVPTQHQPDVRTRPGVPYGDHPARGQLRDHGALAAFFARLTRPRLGGAARWPPPAPGARPGPVWQAALQQTTTGPTSPPHPARRGRTKRLVRHHPATPPALGRDPRRGPLLSPLWLGVGRDRWQKAARPAPSRLRVVGDPFSRQIQVTS